MKFDDILEEINGLGPFQITLLLLFCIPRIVLPCHFLLNNFIAVLPPHHCDFSSLDSGGLFRNLTQEQRLTVSIPARENGAPEACEMFAVPQVQLLANTTNITGLPTVPCQSGWIYDNSSFTSSLAMEVQGFIFGCPSQFLGLVNFHIWDVKKDCCTFIFLQICTKILHIRTGRLTGHPWAFFSVGPRL